MKRQAVASPVVDPVSVKVRQETEQAYYRINNPSAAQRLWERWLSPADRARLGGDLELAWSKHNKTVGMFMHARGVDQVEAIIHVAADLGFLRAEDRDRLLREWGLPAGSAVNDQRPSWNPETGKLQLGTKLIRSVKLFREPSNIQQLIEEFAAENWPEVVNNPFTSPEQLHDAVRALNKGLKQIRFHAIAGETKCRWEFVARKRKRRL